MGNQLCCANSSKKESLDNIEGKKGKKGKSQQRIGSIKPESRLYEEHHNLLLYAAQNTIQLQKNEDQQEEFSVDTKSKRVARELKADACSEGQVVPFDPQLNPNESLGSKDNPESQALLCFSKMQGSLNTSNEVEKFLLVNDKLDENSIENKINSEKSLTAQKAANLCECNILNDNAELLERKQREVFESLQQSENQGVLDEATQAPNSLKVATPENNQSISPGIDDNTSQEQIALVEPLEEEKPNIESDEDGIKSIENSNNRVFESLGACNHVQPDEGYPASMAEGCEVEEEEKPVERLDEEAITLLSALPNDLQVNEDAAVEADSNLALTPEKESEFENEKFMHYNNEPLNARDEAQNSLEQQQERAEESTLKTTDSEGSQNVTANTLVDIPNTSCSNVDKPDFERSLTQDKSSKRRTYCKALYVIEYVSKVSEPTVNSYNILSEDDTKTIQYQETRRSSQTESSEEISKNTEADTKESYIDSKISLDTELAEFNENTQISQNNGKKCVTEILDNVLPIRSAKKTTICPTEVRSGKLSIDDINFPPLSQLTERPVQRMKSIKPKFHTASQSTLSNCSDSTSQSQDLEDKARPKRSKKFRRYPVVKQNF